MGRYFLDESNLLCSYHNRNYSIIKKDDPLFESYKRTLKVVNKIVIGDNVGFIVVVYGTKRFVKSYAFRDGDTYREFLYFSRFIKNEYHYLTHTSPLHK